MDAVDAAEGWMFAEAPKVFDPAAAVADWCTCELVGGKCEDSLGGLKTAET